MIAAPALQKEDFSQHLDLAIAKICKYTLFKM